MQVMAHYPLDSNSTFPGNGAKKPKLGCHPQHDTKGAGTKICKCSSEINMKSASAQIIPM
jgi:hypothetical protein